MNDQNFETIKQLKDDMWSKWQEAAESRASDDEIKAAAYELIYVTLAGIEKKWTPMADPGHMAILQNRCMGFTGASLCSSCLMNQDCVALSAILKIVKEKGFEGLKDLIQGDK